MVLIKICMLRQSSGPKGPIRVAVFDAHCERNQIGPFQKPSQQDDGVYIYIYIYTYPQVLGAKMEKSLMTCKMRSGGFYTCSSSHRYLRGHPKIHPQHVARTR